MFTDIKILPISPFIFLITRLERCLCHCGMFKDRVQYCILMEETVFWVPLLVLCVCLCAVDEQTRQVLKRNNECFQLLSRRVSSFSSHHRVIFFISLACILRFIIPRTFSQDLYWSEQKNLFINNINHKSTINELLRAFMWMWDSIKTGLCVSAQHAH